MLKLSTQGTLDANRTFAEYRSAPRLRVTQPFPCGCPSGPQQMVATRRTVGFSAGRTGNSGRGSWTMTAVDARTGPQDTGLDGAASGNGPPPADILTVTDLSPRT